MSTGIIVLDVGKSNFGYSKYSEMIFGGTIFATEGTLAMSPVTHFPVFKKKKSCFEIFNYRSDTKTLLAELPARDLLGIQKYIQCNDWL